jgi:hypothetical protein
MITLPTVKSQPKATNPKLGVFFGKPKSGKTTIFASLENNLIIDLEDGTDYLEAISVKAKNLSDLKEIREAIKTANNPYKYITIDTITKLEEMVMPLAVKLYKDTPMGKNFLESDIRKLPQGAGYLYLREAFFEVVNSFRDLCEGLILIGHANSTQINKQGKDLSEMDLDLAGKLKRLVAADADALGYVYREGKQTIISFEAGEDAIVEARPAHLKGKKIVVAQSDENNEITTFIDRIYLK